MSDGVKLHQLEIVTRQMYERKRIALSDVLARENRLRDQIAQLSNMPKTEIRQDLSLQVIGADILWQGWVGRSKAELNTQLARVLAEKEHHMKNLRVSYGKVLAVQELQRKFNKTRQVKRRQRALDIVIERAVHQTNRGDQ